MERVAWLGPRGFRAVLWHQGESDANQDSGHGISGEQYRVFMEKLIRASRQKAGWEVPWLVAQASYHSEKDPGCDDLRSGQKALWDSGIAFEGPDTDKLGGEYRAGVHFNAKGLQAHGQLWAEKVAKFIERGEKEKP
jgi:hypothetical protein